MAAEFDKETQQIVKDILGDYESDRVINQFKVFEQPDTDVVIDILDKLIKIVLPGFFREKRYRFYNLTSQLNVLLEDVMFHLDEQIQVAIRQNPAHAEKTDGEIQVMAREIVLEFFRRIPKIREYAETDVEAFFEGDPAAYNKNEVILTYPGYYAITVNRIAHELYLLGVPLIPRIMTEHAHSSTGIDIHPGTTIGKYFFIDHGTGIVIGETAIIGEHVRVYQGVTIGALSTRGGQRLRGKKRHPTIEDNVIIYAGASILGGETVIGSGSVIGSNTFITSSIEPGSRVSIKNLEMNIHNGGEKKQEEKPASGEEYLYYMI